MEEKIYIWNATKRTSQYGEYFTWWIRLKDLEKLDNGKWWVNFTMSELKTPWKFNETHCITFNSYKKEVDTSKAKPIEDISLDSIPF